MKHLKPILLMVGAVFLFELSGCAHDEDQTETVAEGVIYSVEYKKENGQTGGFTRINHVGAVPGRNGSWNVDAYGQLTRDYLIVTYPQQKDLGPRIIPARRLLDVQFGDGGIIKVDKKTRPVGE